MNVLVFRLVGRPFSCCCMRETPVFAPCPNVYRPSSAPRIIHGAPAVWGCVGACLFFSCASCQFGALPACIDSLTNTRRVARRTASSQHCLRRCRWTSRVSEFHFEVSLSSLSVSDLACELDCFADVLKWLSGNLGLLRLLLRASKKIRCQNVRPGSLLEARRVSNYSLVEHRTWRALAVIIRRGIWRSRMGKPRLPEGTPLQQTATWPSPPKDPPVEAGEMEVEDANPPWKARE